MASTDFTKDPAFIASAASSGHNMDMSSAMNMSMVFVVSTTTPLYAAAWTPKSLGQYAGACVFLVVLAVAFRFLLAFKTVQEHAWKRRAAALQPVVFAPPESGRTSGASVDKAAPGEPESPAAAADGQRTAPEASGWAGHPWRFSTDLPRACMAVVISGVGYLL